jgi:hypothetical protein
VLQTQLIVQHNLEAQKSCYEVLWGSLRLGAGQVFQTQLIMQHHLRYMDVLCDVMRFMGCYEVLLRCCFGGRDRRGVAP